MHRMNKPYETAFCTVLKFFLAALTKPFCFYRTMRRWINREKMRFRTVLKLFLGVTNESAVSL